MLSLILIVLVSVLVVGYGIYASIPALFIVGAVAMFLLGLKMVGWITSKVIYMGIGAAVTFFFIYYFK